LKTLVLLAALALVAPSASSQSWDYVAVSHNGLKAGEWETNRGKASVTWSGRKVRIEVTFEEAKDFGPAMVIEGSVTADGAVRATASYLATDQTPDKLSGVYRKRISHQTWSNERKRVTSEEIVFSYPQNWQFMAFRTERVGDAK
jgi:hypothetical protein